MKHFSPWAKVYIISLNDETPHDTQPTFDRSRNTCITKHEKYSKQFGK